jgi:NDP-sugar pyrophosphorylase family protein
MRAIIIAEHSECQLSPLTARTPYPLLPLAGKPILMHALEVLHRSSIREVDVVSPELHQQLETEIDTGPFMGMTVRFVHAMPDLKNASQHSLIVGLSDIVDTDWNDILDDLGDLDVHALIPIKMTMHAIPVAMLVPPHFGRSSLNWTRPGLKYSYGNFDDKISCDWSELHRTEAIQLPINPQYLISTGNFEDYYQANFALLKGKFNYMKSAGREYLTGHRSAPKARVNERSILSRHGYFGSYCRIDKTARLYGDVIIGNSAIVDKGARVSDSIICDNTYIGSNIDCRKAIVNGNLMVKVDTGVCIEIDDPVLFGAIN